MAYAFRSTNPALSKLRVAVTIGLTVLWIALIALIVSGKWEASKIESVATAIGILGAGSFFAYKAVVGFFITNADLHLQARRSPAGSGEDFLAASVEIKKGERGTLVIHDLAIRVCPDGGKANVIPVDVRRLSYRTVTVSTRAGDVERVVVAHDVQSMDAPFLHLSPGESAQFGAYARVPSHLPCTVEAVLVGRKPSDRPVGQWRASVVSLPTNRVDDTSGAG